MTRRTRANVVGTAGLVGLVLGTALLGWGCNPVTGPSEVVDMRTVILMRAALPRGPVGDIDLSGGAK